MPNGDIYQGYLRNGKKNGRGVLMMKQSGRNLEGLWQNDLFISEIKWLQYFITAVHPHLIAHLHALTTTIGEVFINLDYNNGVGIKKQAVCHNHLPASARSRTRLSSQPMEKLSSW